MSAGVFQEEAPGKPHRIKQHRRMEVMLAVSENEVV